MNTQNLKFFGTLLALLFAVSCGRSKQMTRVDKGQKRSPSTSCSTYNSCPGGDATGVKGGQVGDTGYEGPEISYEPAPSNPTGSTASTSPSSPDYGSIVSGIGDLIGAISTSGSSSTTTKSETGTSTSTSPSSPSTSTSTGDACSKSSNQTITVGGSSFSMTKKSYVAYAKVTSIGLYSTLTTVIGGNSMSINSSFSYSVKNGSVINSGSYSMARAQVYPSGSTVTFASMASGSWTVGANTFNVKYDLSARGACLAVYGTYNGGYPILVIP